MAINIVYKVCKCMKILPKMTYVAQNRKQVINKHIKTFDNLITDGNYGRVQKLRNFLGLPMHAVAATKLLYDAFNGEGPISALIWAKVNYDFVQFIRNINKRKAALLSEYLKGKGVNNHDEIRYAVKKYFVRLGMPFYPITHPKGMKQIVENGTYPRSFETGIVYARTDKKSIFENIPTLMFKLGCKIRGIKLQPEH
ncbi:hypothetical protein J6E39_02155 [bacterium]|nr:hypothetical protein [bacterium]